MFASITLQIVTMLEASEKKQDADKQKKTARNGAASFKVGRNYFFRVRT